MLSSLMFLLVLPCYNSFLSPHTNRHRHYAPVLGMVRNIDLPEALVFYGMDSFVDTDGSELKGVTQLLMECNDIGTPVAILSNQSNIHGLQVSCYSGDLGTLVDSLLVQPRGFGGSSGFGRRAAEPERPPNMQHVVVLCTTVEQCREARYYGARCVCLNDNELADAIVSGWDEICLDDVSTPGSYWLNPPYPKDDDGNRVDMHHRNGGGEADSTSLSQFDMDSILADLDSL